MLVLLAGLAGLLATAPATADASPAPQQSAPERQAPLGTWIEFEHFQTRAVKIERESGFVYVWVRTCVRSNPDGGDGRVRVSNDPWSIFADRRYTPRDGGEGGGLRQPLFPAETRLAPGDCRSGWLEFWTGSAAKVQTVNYGNSLGDQAGWSRHYTGERELWWGEWAEFDHYAVRVAEVERVNDFVYARIRHCAKSAPGLVDEPMPTGHDTWRLHTPTGVVEPRDGGEGGGHRQPLFPSSAEVAPGECRSGWLEFWAPDTEHTGYVTFDLPVVDSASWSRPH